MPKEIKSSCIARVAECANSGKTLAADEAAAEAEADTAEAFEAALEDARDTMVAIFIDKNVTDRPNRPGDSPQGVAANWQILGIFLFIFGCGYCQDRPQAWGGQKIVLK